MNEDASPMCKTGGKIPASYASLPEGRYHIITQLAIYTWCILVYKQGIYWQLGDDMVPIPPIKGTNILTIGSSPLPWGGDSEMAKHP